MRIAVIGSFIFWAVIAMSCVSNAEACDMADAVYPETVETPTILVRL